MNNKGMEMGGILKTEKVKDEEPKTLEEAKAKISTLEGKLEKMGERFRRTLGLVVLAGSVLGAVAANYSGKEEMEKKEFTKKIERLMPLIHDLDEEYTIKSMDKKPEDNVEKYAQEVITEEMANYNFDHRAKLIEEIVLDINDSLKK